MAISYRAAQTLIKRGELSALGSALDEGLDPNSSNQNGWTLLMLAAVERALPPATLLVERGADVNRRNRHDETALSLAAQKANIPLLEFLLAHGATKDAKPHGTTLSTWLTNSPNLTAPQLAEVLQVLGI